MGAHGLLGPAALGRCRLPGVTADKVLPGPGGSAAASRGSRAVSAGTQAPHAEIWFSLHEATGGTAETTVTEARPFSKTDGDGSQETRAAWVVCELAEGMSQTQMSPGHSDTEKGPRPPGPHVSG